MSGYCKCGAYHEEDDERPCAQCKAAPDELTTLRSENQALRDELSIAKDEIANFKEAMLAEEKIRNDLREEVERLKKDNGNLHRILGNAEKESEGWSDLRKQLATLTTRCERAEEIINSMKSAIHYGLEPKNADAGRYLADASQALARWSEA